MEAFKEKLGSSPEAQLPVEPEILTFTGIDISTEYAAIKAIHSVYPKTEFGILVGSHNDTGMHSRFPPLKKVEAWRLFSMTEGVPMAIHLCGDVSLGIMQGTGISVASELCAGFGRVQINSRAYDYDRVAEFAELVACPKVILQRRNGERPLNHPKVEYLFDLSGGTGRESMEFWPAADRKARSGYAGGLNASNIAAAIRFVDSQADCRIWLDMESGVRSEEDYLDPNKIAQICRMVFQV